MYSRCCLLTQLGKCSGKKPCCSFLLFCGACFLAVVLSSMEKLKLKYKELFGSRGCVGCCTKPSSIFLVDEPYNRRTRGKPVEKEHTSEYLWSSGTFEMDNSAAQSRRSISSISTSNQPSDPQSSAGSEINPPEFVNHGLLLWNQIRQEWIGKRESQTQSQTLVREPRISWNATYENLLGSNKPFAHPIPMGEMIDFLVDIWEQEGLYDW